MAFAFDNLPPELKLEILRWVMKGWKATLERHEKREQNRWTVKIWSSAIYDMLMVSLTCKDFHASIQAIQHDPSLYSGELDMMEENGDISYLFEAGLPEPRSRFQLRPCHGFRTKIFIKSSPYNKTDDEWWRNTRTRYHAAVRTWLVQNTRSLAVYLDELLHPVPWHAFPKLRHLTLFWPQVKAASPSADICNLPPERIAHLASQAKSHGLSSYFNEIIPYGSKLFDVFAEALERGMTLTVIWQLIDWHSIARPPTANLNDEQGDKFYWRDSEMEITCSVDGSTWRLLSSSCLEPLHKSIRVQDSPVLG